MPTDSDDLKLPTQPGAPTSEHGQIMFAIMLRKECSIFTRGLTVCFFDSKTDEPLIIVGEITYHNLGNVEARQSCGRWDLWYLYFGSGDTLVRHAVLQLRGPGPSASAQCPHPGKVDLAA
jgi:hypothetical protein